MTGRFDEAIQRNAARARTRSAVAEHHAEPGLVLITRRAVLMKSITTFEIMLEAAPDFAYGLVTYSWALRHVGKAEEAVESAEKALAIVERRSVLCRRAWARPMPLPDAQTTRAPRWNVSTRCQRLVMSRLIIAR